jgi:hypothetical protein
VPDVRVLDEVRPGGSAGTELVLPGLPDRVSARELIRTRVREEVAKANADRSQPRRLLVAPVEAEEMVNGYRVRDGRTIEWERQAEIALDAFDQQAFFMFADGRQVGSLDQEIPLHSETEVRFLRLTPLVGG